jgi:soluble lytic murein transglycosylase-like protein
MQSLKNVSGVMTAFAVAGIAALAASSGQMFVPVQGTTAAAAVAAVNTMSTLAVPPAISLAAPAAAAAAAVARATTGPDDELRARIRWVPVNYGTAKVLTLDAASRLLLAQEAAERANLESVGLSFQDVYGVINAETSWIPRTGLGKNGVQSMGLAQFEPGTAKGLGLKDPHDPLQAVVAAAMNMKHGAEWAADKIEHLKLPPAQYAQKLREGVSIYYNLSVRGRNKWDGVNTAKLPVETRRHILNVQRGAQRAAELAEEIAS